MAYRLKPPENRASAPRRRSFWLTLLMLCVLSANGFSQPVAGPGRFSLQEAIDAALKANLTLKTAREETEAALANKNVQRSRLLPTFSTEYQYLRNDDQTTVEGLGVTQPKDEFLFSTSISQPIFKGFSLINQYRLAGLGLETAQLAEQLARQDLTLATQRRYFTVLRTEKLLSIARQTVTQIDAQREVAQNFYDVGMTPLNDLLQAQVELANAQQNEISARNNLETARSEFNTLLRRPINAAVQLEDIETYTPYEYDLAHSQKTALANRLEFKLADLEVASAQKEIDVARSSYLPAVDLRWTYQQEGEDPDVQGGIGVFGDAHSWNVAAVASWDFWQWGRTYYDVAEKRRRLNQAGYRREELADRIRLEVKQAYLKNRESEKNIATVEKAVAQARENYRINQESYREQVTTATDVLIAQTLLTRTMTNYYNALYDFKISKAALYRAMGLVLGE